MGNYKDRIRELAEEPDLPEEDDEPVRERTINTANSIAISILLKDKDMFRFLLRHNYTNLSGIIGLALSIGAVALILIYHQSLSSERLLALAILALLFTVVQPLQLRSRAKKQIKRQEMFADPLEYYIAEEGIVICQKDQFVEVKWSDVRKVVKTKKAIYIYLSTIRAFILPMEQCGEKWDKLCNKIDRKVRVK